MAVSRPPVRVKLPVLTAVKRHRMRFEIVSSLGNRWCSKPVRKFSENSGILISKFWDTFIPVLWILKTVCQWVNKTKWSKENLA